MVPDFPPLLGHLATATGPHSCPLLPQVLCTSSLPSFFSNIPRTHTPPLPQVFILIPHQSGLPRGPPQLKPGPPPDPDLPFLLVFGFSPQGTHRVISHLSLYLSPGISIAAGPEEKRPKVQCVISNILAITFKHLYFHFKQRQLGPREQVGCLPYMMLTWVRTPAPHRVPQAPTGKRFMNPCRARSQP